jgi:hypothetical protein
MVSLQARQPSVIALTVAERVQLDRVVTTPDGPLAERHGALLAPGTHDIALAPGHYCFRTLSDTQLTVVEGAVDTWTRTGNDKNPFPEPPPRPDALPATKGDEPNVPADALPRLTIV